MNEKLKQLLNNDAMIRPPVANVNLKDLRDQNGLLEDLSSKPSEAISLIEDYLQKNPHSVMGLYMLTILRVKSGLEFKNHADHLVHLFAQFKKTSHIIFLAREILKYVESLYALNILISHIENHSTEEQLEIYERILKQDNTDYHLCVRIAKLKEKFNFPQEALRYYKMAFYRALEAKKENDVISIWENLIALDPENSNFFLDNGKRLLKFFSKENSQLIFEKVFNYYFQKYQNHLDICLALIKEMIQLDVKSHEYRQKVVTLYKEKYKKHSKLDEIISFTNIIKPWKKLAQQIELFEKLIQFDVGIYVHHNGFGYGSIRKINMPIIKKAEQVNSTQLFIDFKSKKNHLMTLRIALNSLTICSPDDLNALKLFDVEKLESLKEGDKEELLTSLFKTYGKAVSSIDIKNLLVPLIYSQKDWAEQWKKLKQVINISDQFEVKNKFYYFKTSSKSYKEELIQHFNTSKNALAKLKIADIFLLNFGADDETFKGIENNLIDLLSEEKEEESQKMLVLTYLKYFSHQYHQKIDIDFAGTFSDITDIADVKNIFSMFDKLPSNALKHTLIDLMLMYFLEKDSNVIQELFFTPNIQAKQYLLDQLQKNNASKTLNMLIATAFHQEQKSPKHFFIVAKHILQNGNKNLSYNNKKLFENLVDLLDRSYKDLNFSKENVEAKWLFQQMHSLLFGDSTFFNFLRKEAEGEVKEMIIEKLNKMHFLENYLKVEIKEIMTK